MLLSEAPSTPPVPVSLADPKADKSQRRDARIARGTLYVLTLLLALNLGHQLPENTMLWPLTLILGGFALIGSSVFLWNQDRKLWSLLSLLLGGLSIPFTPFNNLGPRLLHWLNDGHFVWGATGVHEPSIQIWIGLLFVFTLTFVGVELWKKPKDDDAPDS